MLVRRDYEGGALAIGQLSHAWLSGQLARAWGNEEFPAPEPREPIALGAEQHDVGWALFDLRPGLSTATGLPRTFLELTPDEHLSIWRTAPDRLLSVSAYAALVVSLHGTSLSQLRAAGAQAGVEDLLVHVAEEQRRQEDLRKRLGIREGQMQRIQRQMWTWDGLSLALCNGWDPFVARDVPARGGLVDLELRSTQDGELRVEPWPFSLPRVEVCCEGRPLAAHYGGEAQMQRALEESEPVTLSFVLVA